MYNLVYQKCLFQAILAQCGQSLFQQQKVGQKGLNYIHALETVCLSCGLLNFIEEKTKDNN